MAEPLEKLQYKTVEEKTAALELIENKPGGPTEDDLDEIDRISEAEVLEAGESEQTEEDDIGLPPKELPKETEKKPIVGEPKEDRDFRITEELIDKYDEMYYDDATKRNRKHVTQKSADELLKSYISAQKNNRYLKNKRLPAEHEAGYNKAKEEYEAKMAPLLKELEEYKTKPPAILDPAIVKQPDVPSKTAEELNNTLKIISETDDGEIDEHVDDLKRAILLSQKVLQENDNRYNESIEKLRKESDSKFVEFKTSFQTEQEKMRAKETAEAAARQQQDTIIGVYAEIDAFAANPKLPEEIKVDQKYAEMIREALTFQSHLAEAYSGKTQHDMTANDWNKCMELSAAAYLNNTPEIISKVKQNGIEEPLNYKKWVFLDQIDAIRTGWWRDPQTNQWTKRYDQLTGKELRFPDMMSAYNYFLDETGQRDKIALQEKRGEVEKVVAAINKRDNSVVQLDDSKMLSEGDGQALTKEDAVKMCENINMDFITSEWRNGNLDPLNRLNAALQRLEQEPINPATFI